MSQHYSDRSRESEPHALPDVETFRANYAYCSECSSLVFFDHYTADDGRLVAKCSGCGEENELSVSGWFYWFCLPGCLPDSEPFGPFDTEDAAIADARENDNSEQE